MITRRDALKSAALASAGFFVSTSVTRALAQAAAASGPHTLPPLGYAFGALEPAIDAQTMEIHHGRHHAAYVSNLNKALADYPELQKLTAEQLVAGLDKVPEKIRTAVRNNAGGHVNHTLFWQCLKVDAAPLNEGPLMEALGELFENKEQGQQMFYDKAMSVFGSGWVWVGVEKNGKLVLESLPNQDSPLMFGRKPLLGLDVWEHAYYLKYQNRRADYVKAVMGLINWPFLEARYEKLTA